MKQCFGIFCHITNRASLLVDLLTTLGYAIVVAQKDSSTAPDSIQSANTVVGNATLAENGAKFTKQIRKLGMRLIRKRNALSFATLQAKPRNYLFDSGKGGDSNNFPIIFSFRAAHTLLKNIFNPMFLTVVCKTINGLTMPTAE